MPGYADRVTTIEFNELDAEKPKIYADGPTDSPHRYPDRGLTELCVWYFSDPPERRWVPDDGLLSLYGMVEEHLLKEAWWRESGTWVGEEAPHAVPAHGSQGSDDEQDLP